MCSKPYKSRKSLLRHQETCLKKYKNTRIQEWDDFKLNNESDDVDKDMRLNNESDDVDQDNRLNNESDDVDQFDLNSGKLPTGL